MNTLVLSPLLIAGLPWTAWVLWFASVGLGLGIVLAFYFKYRRTVGDPQNKERSFE